MKTGWKIALSFITGAVVGAFVTKKYMDSKVEYYDDEEIVVEELDGDGEPIQLVRNKSFNSNENRIQYDKIRSTEDAEYKRLLNELRYQNEEEEEECLEGILHETTYVSEERDNSKPYNISQEEFEDIDSYESDEYTYYTDGYVTDSFGIAIPDEDVVNALGVGFEQYFGSYCDDQIWIRNERLQMDFSVIRDLDRFVDVASPRAKRMAGLL